MGSLADKKCLQGQRVSGILVKKNFNYHILNPSDLSSKFYSPSFFKLKPLPIIYDSLFTRRFRLAAYTELAMSTVKQTQAIPFTGPYSLLVCHLRNLTGQTAIFKFKKNGVIYIWIIFEEQRCYCCRFRCFFLSPQVT